MAELSTADILRQAKALIPDEAHWARGNAEAVSGAKFGKFCAITAISHAGGADAQAAHDLFSDAIHRIWIGKWNDAKGRTLQQLWRAFDKAIALAEAADG